MSTAISIQKILKIEESCYIFKMKTVFVFAAVLGLCVCRPPKTRVENPQEATIIQFDSNNIGTGPYSFSYQTSDGTSRQEVAELKNPGTEDEVMVVKGSYTYIGSDGLQYTVTYTADENGYHPQGEHIPGQ